MASWAKLSEYAVYPLVGPAAPDEQDFPVNGQRQDEPVVVVGVFADEVDAAGARISVGGAGSEPWVCRL